MLMLPWSVLPKMTLLHCGVTRQTLSVLEFLQSQLSAAYLKDPQSGNWYHCAEYQYVHCSNVNMAKIQNPRCTKNFSIEDFVRDFCLRFNQHAHLLLSLNDHCKPRERSVIEQTWMLGFCPHHCCCWQTHQNDAVHLKKAKYILTGM